MRLLRRLWYSARLLITQRRWERVYDRYCSIADEYDCGKELAESFRPELIDMKLEIDRLRNQCMSLYMRRLEVKHGKTKT